MSDLAYGDPETPTGDASYSDVAPTGPTLSNDALNARASRANFALGDKSPGHQVLKDAFSSGNEGQVRQAAAAQADAEFRNDKITAVQQIAAQGTPITDKDVNNLVNIGTTPEANPSTVFEDKFGKNFVGSALAGDPGRNLVFQTAFNDVPEETQTGTRIAGNAISRHQIVQGVLEDAQAAYDHTVPWFDTEQQKGIVGDTAMDMVGGLASMVTQRNLLNQSKSNSWLPGTNKLEQIQYLYLLPHDQVKDALMAAAGPGSEMWKNHPKEALDFIRAAHQYSASDSYIDNVFGVTNVASLLPLGTTLRGIGLMRRGVEVAQPAIQTAEKAAESVARDVLATTPKAPTGGSPMNANQMTAASNALDVLGGSPKPPAPGYYVPKAAVTKEVYNSKDASQTVARQFTSQVDNGIPRVFNEDGVEVQLSRTPQEGHLPVHVSTGQPTQTYTTKHGNFEFNSEGVNVNGQDKKTIYVDKGSYEKLSQVLDEDKNLTILEGKPGTYHVGDLENATPGKRLPNTTVKTSSQPSQGLYPIHLPEGNDKMAFEDFGARITRIDRGTPQRVEFGPEIKPNAEVEAKKALADITKAAAEKDPQDALSKMGQHEAAASISAVKKLNHRFDDVVALGDPEAIRRNVPSLASPQTYFMNSSSLSAERARRLAEQATQTSSEMGAAILDPTRVERMTQEALDRAVNNAKTAVAQKYNRASDAILDQTTVWDSASSTYKVQTKFGKKDGTLFDSSVQAKHFRDFQYRIGQGATVEQEGTKFYLSHIMHADETARDVREGLIVSGNETPRGLWNTFLTAVTGKVNPLGNNLRSSAYTVSPFQRNNRIVATHSPSILRDAVEKAADDIEALGGKFTTQERQELQRILEHNRDYMTPEGERGQFYKSALEFETAFNSVFNKMPTEKQIVAYDQFTRLSDLDWVLRELDWHRDKARQGVRNYRLPFTKVEDGIPQNGKTDWFNAKKVENFDPLNTQDANVYVMPEGRMTTKYSLRKETVEDLLTQKNIKDGRYQILQVYNPGSKPLREATGVKDNIHFVVVDKAEDKALQWGENSVYRPGGHVIYQDNHFMKQSQIGTGSLGRLTHFGDTTVKSFATPKEGQMWTDRYNTARELLHNNDEAGLKAYIDAGNLPETVPEFKKLFTDGGASLSTEHPFVLTTTGRNTFQSSEELARQYPGLKDTFSSYDLTQTQDSKFLAQRDKQLNTVANTGTEENPVYVNVPSRLYDPYTALQKGMAQIVRQRWMGDYKISAAESWVQEFGMLFDQSKLPIDKLRQNPTYWMMHADGNLDLGVARTNPEMVAAAMTSRKNILNFIGARDEVGALMDGLERKLVEMTESIGGKKLAQFAEEKALPAITNAPAYARAGAFHSVIGLFNPVQLFQQAQGLTHVLALSPVNGLKGSTAAALARIYRYTEDVGILNNMADKASALGWNRDNYIEAYQAWKASGTHNIGGEAALLNQVGDPKMFRNGFSTFLDKGQMFFKAGESIVRDTSYFTAYQDWRAANPTAVLNNRAMGDIGRRFDTLSLNMTRASNAAYNEGILSPATQFWTWNARFTEQMLGKQLTLAEKARAFTMYSAMYGVPATLGGVTFGVVPYANYNDIRQYALSNNINVSDKFYKAFSEGLPSLLTNAVTGHETDFQRFSPNATQVKDIIDGKKSAAEILGGASAGFVANVAQTVWPAMMYGMSAFKKDSNFPLHGNDVVNVLENISSFNNAEKSVVALHLGQLWSKREGLTDNKIDTFEGILLSLGLQPKRDSDAYLKMDYVKNLKSAQDKLGKFMQEDWKIAMKAGMRGDFQTMTDYMTRVHAYTQMGNFTKQQEIDQFKKASHLNEDLVTGAERQFRENVQQLQSYPAMKKYLENTGGK